MISVGIKELKAKLSGHLDQVRRGMEIVITDRGQEIAKIIPLSRERSAVRGMTTSGTATWAGGKPVGLKGVRVKGGPLSKTVLENRR
jgi:prevent-host-death family protein